LTEEKKNEIAKPQSDLRRMQPRPESMRTWL
jgi:hypothetical protein